MAGWGNRSEQQMSEPDLIAPGHVDWRSAWIKLGQPSAAGQGGLLVGRIWPLAILLLAPAIAVLSVLIVAGLLGFFVAWLATVGFLFTATLMSDLLRGFWRLAHPPVGAVKQAVG